MKLRRAVYLLTLATLIDVFLTLRGLTERNEGNQIILFWMNKLGTITGIVTYKTVLIGGAIFLLICASRKGRKVESILYIGTMITLLLSSMWLI